MSERKRRNQFIQSQVRDILQLTADHNVKMATKSPATQQSINEYGEPLNNSAERIIKLGNRMNPYMPCDKQDADEVEHE